MKNIDSIAKFNFDELELDNDFWKFSLQAWKSEALRNCLLDCQNTRNMKVNQILFVFWASSKSMSLKGYFESKSPVLDEWQSGILEPIRNARKLIPKQRSLMDFRHQIQERELQAEQIEQALMYQSVQGGFARQDEDLIDTLLNNLILSEVVDLELLLLLAKLFAEVRDYTLPSEGEIVDLIAKFLAKLD